MAQFQHYVNVHTAKSKYFGEKTLWQHPVTAAPSTGSHVHKSSLSLPSSCSSNSFHFVQVLQLLHFHKADWIYRVEGCAGRRPHHYLCKKSYVGWLGENLLPQLWTLPVRDWHNLEWANEGSIPLGLVSSLHWVIAEWRLRVVRPEWDRSCDNFVMLHEASGKRLLPLLTPTPPTHPSFTPLQKDSGSKRKQWRCMLQLAWAMEQHHASPSFLLRRANLCILPNRVLGSVIPHPLQP